MKLLQRVNAVPDMGQRGVEFYRRRIARFTRYEQVIALLLMAIPCVLLRYGDDTPLTMPCESGSPNTCRDSISAFYDMSHEPLFYMPLTIAAVLFFSNAVLRRENWWNALVGIALAGVVFFDHDAYDLAHTIFAAVFFLTTMVIVSWYLPKNLTGTTGIRIGITPFRAIRSIAIFLVQAAIFAVVFTAFNLFVAEAVQLWIVAGHYILHSIKLAARDRRVST